MLWRTAVFVFLEIYRRSPTPSTAAMIREGVWTLSKNCRGQWVTRWYAAGPDSYVWCCDWPAQSGSALPPTRKTTRYDDTAFLSHDPATTDWRGGQTEAPLRRTTTLFQLRGSCQTVCCYHLKALKLQQASIATSLGLGKRFSSSCWTRTQKNLKFKRGVCFYIMFCYFCKFGEKVLIYLFLNFYVL